jgi:hypothetical protein
MTVKQPPHIVDEGSNVPEKPKKAPTLESLQEEIEGLKFTVSRLENHVAILEKQSKKK